MKKLSFLLLIVSVFVYGQSWNYIGDSGFSTGISNNLSLGIDLPSGEIWVAFQDISDLGKLNIYSYGSSSDWDNVVSGLSDGYANHINLNVDSNGNPYYSYIDGNYDYIGFGYFSDSGNWRTKNPTNGGNNIGGHSINSITKQDSNGNVFICSFHSSWRLVVYKTGQMGSGFSINHSFAQLGDDNVSQFSFDIKYNNGLIAYSNLDDGGKIDVIRFDGATMSVTDTYNNISDGLSNYFKLSINPFTLQPYIAFQDVENNGKVTVKKLNGESWELVGEEAFSEGLANYVDLAFDSNGVPYVAFQDVNFSNKLSVMSFNGTSWEYVAERGITQGSASHISMKLNSDGEIFVAFKDGSVNNKASVIGYSSALSSTKIGDENIVFYPNPTSSIIEIQQEFSVAKVYDLSGKELLKSNSKTIDLSELPSSVYLLRLYDNSNKDLGTTKVVKL